ncbi:uncharacterized protein B0I36DRAFT_412832 [Microdochium trichocladiopsis]|uniref:Uncharacterized protein n=1 Tax=Microdochium trichocladiopsis TaxID=1682393 RepID=A0A9P8Y094_9PEZI|nr:uncharacterized protein B0I36DRAFT_412832 [Microdochium trichocladiopsis]KAH7027418.1 hypothetical protein B0I36DRAFT_412832 [Microdochium trichocladiopsis]
MVSRQGTCTGSRDQLPASPSLGVVFDSRGGGGARRRRRRRRRRVVGLEVVVGGDAGEERSLQAAAAARGTLQPALISPEAAAAPPGPIRLITRIHSAQQGPQPAPPLSVYPSWWHLCIDRSFTTTPFASLGGSRAGGETAREREKRERTASRHAGLLAITTSPSAATPLAPSPAYTTQAQQDNRLVSGAAPVPPLPSA